MSTNNNGLYLGTYHIYWGASFTKISQFLAMSTLKVLLSILTVIVCATAAFAFYGLYNLDITIRQNLITIGSDATQSQVSLAKANFSLRSGLGQLHQLQIDNPEDFSCEYALAVDNINVTINPKSVMNDVIIIENVSIDNAELIAEEQGYKKLNLHKIHQNISEYLPTPHTTDQNNANNKRYIINSVSLTNSNLRIVTEKFGEKVINIPALTFNDIGKSENGLSPHQLAPALLNPILIHATDEVKIVLSRLSGSHGKEALKKMAERRLDTQAPVKSTQ